MIAGLLKLLGDALSATGAALRTRRDGFADYEAGDYLAADLPRNEVRLALHELSDAALLNIAATVIDGWSPILLKSDPDTNVDLLIDAMRDRAAQFAATAE